LKIDIDAYFKKATHNRGRNESSVKLERKKLKNGITFVTETISCFPSVSAGIWVRGGSRTETPEINGSTHFVEHLVFKGTKNLSYSDIYKAFDRMGGAIDAFTSREIMGFHFRVQKRHFEEAFSILSEIIFEPLFPEEEMERERKVILEEIKMVNDSPSDVVADLFMERAYPNHPLGMPVQGNEKIISKMKLETIKKRHKNLISPSHLIVTATGDIEMEELLKEFQRTKKNFDDSKPNRFEPPKFSSGIKVVEKKHLEQAQIVLGFESEKASSPDRYALVVLANILGGTMSSRLFTEIREKLGLVYSISSEFIGQYDGGIFAIQAASSHDAAPKTVQETIKVLHDFCQSGPSKEEIEIAKENLIGGLILSLESTSSRMGRIARNELYFGRQFDVKEAISGVEKVSSSKIIDLARKTFNPKRMNVVILGRKNALKGVDFSILERKWQK
jgi:predicted Zn-dependent peptidase